MTWQRINKYAQQRGRHIVAASRLGERWRFSLWEKDAPRTAPALGYYDTSEAARQAAEQLDPSPLDSEPRNDERTQHARNSSTQPSAG